MPDHRVLPEDCYAIFTKVEAKSREAAKVHRSLSADIDALGTLCTGESSILAAKLNGLYNRILTEGMTSAEQQLNNASAGGRDSVAAVQAGHLEMADRTAREANEVEEVHIKDGKPA